MALPCLLVFLTICVITEVNSQFYIHKPKQETFRLAAGVMETVLAAATHSQCSVILLPDGNTSDSSLFVELVRLTAFRGVGVFQVAADGQEANVTQAQLSRLVGQTQQLRQLSWCVTVVVVSDDPAFLAAFAQWSLKGRLLVWSTRLLAVTRLPLQQLWDLKRTFSMTNSMLLIVDGTPESQRGSVYIYLPYSPQEAQALKVASWSPHRGLVLTTQHPLFPDKFSRFEHGASLVVVAEEYQPHAALTGAGAQGAPTSFMGPMVTLLQLIAKSLNFTYTFVRPPDGSWGTKMEDGSWSGMVGVVTREEADIGLGPFGMSAMRAEVIDYTRPILIDSLKVLAGQGRPEVDPWGFLLPLTPLVWAAILTTLLVVLTTVFLMSKCFIMKNFRPRRFSTNLFYKYFRVLLQQDNSVQPDRWWEQLVFAGWMMMTLVLTRSYAGNLMSLLAVRHIPQPYQTLRDVIDDTGVTMIWEANTVYVQYIKSVESGTFREIADSGEDGRMQYQRGFEFPVAVDTVVRKGSHVLMVEDLTTKVFMAQDFSRTSRCDFYTSRETFLPYVFAMIVRKGSPLVHPINQRIMKVTETGLYSHWLEVGLPNSTSCAWIPTKITVTTSLSVTNLWGMFVVFGAGHLLSLLALCFELGGDRVLRSINFSK